MNHLRSEITCHDCPLFNLPEKERQLADIKFSWGVSPREEALESLQHEVNHVEVVMDLGYMYRITGELAVAVVDCAVRQTISNNCPFAEN